jgi:glutamate synthase (NADPH) small chain
MCFAPSSTYGVSGMGPERGAPAGMDVVCGGYGLRKAMLRRIESRDVKGREGLKAPPVEAPTLPAPARARNFDEVLLPWSGDMVQREAARCLQCSSPPCVEACPLRVDIPLALRKAEEGDFAGAARVFLSGNNLPELCGRVCCQWSHCEGACSRMQEGSPPLAVGRIETFLADLARGEMGWVVERPPCTGHRVGVVGAGPASLTVAELLAGEGHLVTVYDQWPDGGGTLRYGLPRFKLDHGLVRKRLGLLRSLGVEFIFNVRIGDEVGVDDLLAQGFEAVFLGTGPGLPEPAGIPGIHLKGVYDALPFLVQANVEQHHRPSALEDPPAVGRRVVVMGGGDTAMDCSRTALRLGAPEVTCYYRRGEGQAPGNPRDRLFAREEGVALQWGAAPVRILGDGTGRVRAVELVRTEAASFDAGRDLEVKPLEGSEFVVSADTVVLALGCRPDPSLVEETPGLEVDDRGRLRVDPFTGRTTRDRVWAGGGNVTGQDVLARAVAQGRVAAGDIHRCLCGQGS